MLNAAAYYEDWMGIQQAVTLKCGVQITANAGTAHIYGGELEAIVVPVSGLKFSTALGYSHARISSVEPGASFTVGDRIQSVPDWTDTTAIEYTHNLDNNLDLVLRASNVYVGTQTDVSWQLNTLPARNLVNLRAGVITGHNLSGFIFADNVTNHRTYLSDPEEIFTFVPALNRATTNQPRTIGVELSYALRGR